MRCSSGDVQGEALLEWVMKTDLKVEISSFQKELIQFLATLTISDKIASNRSLSPVISGEKVTNSANL